MTECETDETGNIFDKYLQVGMDFPGAPRHSEKDIQPNDTQLICATQHN